jgi:hypothetical protein
MNSKKQKQLEKKAMDAFQEALQTEMEWNWITFDSVVGFVHMVGYDLASVTL